MSQSDIPDDNRVPKETPDGEPELTDTVESGAHPAVEDDAAHTGSHTPLIAEQAYAEEVDSHIVSSAEPASEPLVVPLTGPVAEPATAEQATPYPAPQTPVRRTPVYVQAPTPPENKGNRGFGILVSLVATLVFAVLYAGILSLVLATRDSLGSIVDDVLLLPPFWIPVIFFFLAMALLASIVNRGGWWAWILGGFAVAAIVYGSYLGGVLIHRANEITPAEVADVVRNALLSPAAIISFLVAREVPIWFGAWISSRGRKVRERNAEARREYQRVLDEGPVVS